MKEMLISAGFSDINIQVKENAGDIIKDWMPGSNAEKYVTSVYVTATKRADAPHVVDNVRNCCGAEAALAPAAVAVQTPATAPAPVSAAVSGAAQAAVAVKKEVKAAGAGA